jgi:hypothetical protein
MGRSSTFKASPHMVGATACTSLALAALYNLVKIIYIEINDELEHPDKPQYGPSLTPIATVLSFPAVSILGLFSYLFTCAAADEFKMDLHKAVTANVLLSSVLTAYWAKYYIR